MKKNGLWYFIFYITAFFIFSCGGPVNNTPPASISVNIEDVKEENAIYYDLYPGNIIAINEVELRSEVNGFITNIFFKEGQTVYKGQKLYEIEQNKFTSDYNQAQANLQIAKVNYEKTKNDAERYNQLGDKGLVTKQKVEYTQTDLETAKFQVSSAEAQVAKASNDLSHSIIIAPFEGTIGISMAKKGTYISSGQTLLNTISSDNPIAVDFFIGEKEIGRFMNFKNSGIKDSVFTLILPDKSIYPQPGTIELFDRGVDPQTGTLKVRLTFKNNRGFLKTGMSCNVSVQNKTSKSLPLIPFKAVVEQMGEYFVYVVEKDTARQHKVKIGSPVKDKIIILEGLNPGEKIVTEGIQKLKDGVAVQTGPVKSEKPAVK